MQLTVYTEIWDFYVKQFLIKTFFKLSVFHMKTANTPNTQWQDT